jgi:hypothetical protein
MFAQPLRKLPTLTIFFLQELPQLSSIAFFFFEDYTRPRFGRSQYIGVQLATVKNKFQFLFIYIAEIYVG